MAAFDTSRPTYVSGRKGLGATFAQLFAAIMDWHDARQTRKILARLSDFELEDIGLTRGDINSR
ncbi:DUF1127 domain-containing protein [Marivita sp. GX14005]|uniref:DUF1127 domain-containing protein n=1 Tax=Marivita sp. GX14005 TaxID=2942276 RepID=UPI0020189F87|nr:DUF1127 domain-containing protein [Marivita sp. GX14005]MCL3880987.1 DUF1127 domain-containing protein [Marivita sp. GX14005]